MIIDHHRKVNNETRKCSLFQSSISFVIISIITIENTQNIGLNKQVMQYHKAIFFHCLTGAKNLFRLLQFSSQFFVVMPLSI